MHNLYVKKLKFRKFPKFGFLIAPEFGSKKNLKVSIIKLKFNLNFAETL